MFAPVARQLEQLGYLVVELDQHLLALRVEKLERRSLEASVPLLSE